MKYYTDGFTIGGNPSDIGGGFTIVDENGKIIEREIFERPMTNNEAEILGFIGAAIICSNGDSISTDSRTIISWIRKGSSKSRPDLSVTIHKASKLWREKKIHLQWEGREFNKAGIENEKDIGCLEHKRRPTKSELMILQQDIQLQKEYFEITRW